MIIIEVFQIAGMVLVEVEMLNRSVRYLISCRSEVLEVEGG